MSFHTYQSQTAALPPEVFMGALAWYSVSEVSVSHNDLVQALGANGLGAFIPRLPSDVDVFRRVCTAAQKKKVPTANPDVYVNYLVRDIPMTADHVQKLLVRETVEPGALSYETQVCRLSFERATGAVSYDCTKGDVDAQQIAHNVLTEYNAQQGMLNSYAVRELIRKVILGCAAINVRGSGGGVYFVPQQHHVTLDRLTGFAAAMPGSVMFHVVPLIDNIKQRDMLRNAFESETVDEIERLVGEITTLEKAGQPITAARMEGYVRQLDVLQARTKEYMNLLGDAESTARSSLSIFQRSVLRLSTLVR